MSEPANYKQLTTMFDALPQDIKGWFPEVPDLMRDYTYDVAISYLFTRFENLKRNTLYRGIVKRHGTNAALTWSLIDKDHMSRSRFRELFRIVFDKHIPDEVLTVLAKAEKVRDQVAHGKNLTDPAPRRGIAAAFSFTVLFSDFVERDAGFRPFGDGRGFKGAKASLSPETTRWVLRGMGIPSKEAAEE